MNRAGRRGGFTLVELIVTLAIAGILLAVAIPALRRFILDSERADAGNALLTSLNYAREQALTRRSSVGLCRSNQYANSVPTCASGSGWEDGWMVFSDADGDSKPDEASDVLQIHGALPTGITLRGNRHVADDIFFSPQGMAGNSNGQLAVCDPRGFSTASVIIINLAGRARIVDGADNPTSTAISSCTP